jgi:hypothetical protein
MRREITAISAFSMAISFVAAIALCAQLARGGVLPAWQFPDPVLWAVELAVFGLATYVWRREAALSGWLAGIAGLEAMRLVLSAAGALGLSAFHVGIGFPRAMELLSAPAPRTAAIFFSLMICYPLRSLLPARRLAGGPAKPGTGRATGAERQEEASLVFVGKSPEPPPPIAEARPRSPFEMDPPEGVAGSIELPLGSVLSGIPSEYLGREAREYDPDFPVSIPLALVARQLCEAQVFLRLDDLYELLPPRALIEIASAGLEGEPVLVPLVLPEVVMALPPDALELPPPSPPAWAGFPDPERVVLAAV